MSEPKNRARLLILNHIAQFSLARTFGDGQPFVSPERSFRGSKTPAPGSLVMLSCAPPSKWYLSWVHSCQWPEGHACMQYTLESIEDGELCNWSNVEIWEYSRGVVDEHPEWRWDDAQHAFNDRWLKLCREERDAYIYLPVMANFDGDRVHLGTRTRHGLNDARPIRDFDDWRKVTDEMMLAFYDDAVRIAKERSA